MKLAVDLRWIRLLVFSVALGCSGCSSDYEPPRTREDIFKDQIAVETIYFREDGSQFTAPGTKLGMTVDKRSGKLAWAAWQCNNPNCPARGADGGPHLFPLPDPFAYVDANGEPAIRQPETEEDFQRFNDFIERKCPACLKIRDLDSETEQQRQQYQSWVTRHITPGAEKQLAALEEEMKEYLKRNQPID